METIHTPLLGLIALFPALGALFAATLGRLLPRRVLGSVATFAIAIPFALAVSAVGTMVSNAGESHGHAAYPTLAFTAWNWFGAGNFSVDFGFAFDPLTAVMVLIITGVGSLIHVYSIGYMIEESGFYRYFAYLNLFVFAMLCLVMGDNLVVLFLGWEGVGVASYLLIGFDFDQAEKASAGRKAFITNRVGDLAVILGLGLLIQLGDGLDFETLRQWASHLQASQIAVDGAMTPFGWLLTLTAGLLFFGATGKSAQLPLHVWLPDAMAGPTPVSALIHAATMVTAGVYLIARLSFLFALTPWTLALVTVVGLVSALGAALIACTQTDIKKVLAYSTISQLGFMFVAVGSGSFFAGVFHLMTHAFFKALLFLGAGAVIHALHGEQDIRRMGGLRKHLPVVGGTFLVGCFAIAGLPLVTSGFYSKDEILWFALSNVNMLGGPAQSAAWGWLVWATATATAALTAFYMFRLYTLVFESSSRVEADTLAHLHKPGWDMQAPLVVLAALAVVGGFAGIPVALGGPLPVWFADLHGWLHSVVGMGEAVYSSRFEGHSMALVAMGVAIAASLGGMYAGFALYNGGSGVPAAVAARLGPVYRFIERKFLIDELYAATLGRALHWGGLLLHRVVDVVLIDMGLVGTVAHGTRLLGNVLRQFHNGDVQRYMAMVTIGVALILYLLVR